MKKRKIIIHAGLHKTGSSSIQVACQKNSDFLLSRKIIYPSFGSEKWANHSIPFSVMFMDDQGERSHSVRAEFSSPKQRVDAEKLFKKIFVDEVACAEDSDILISGEDISLFSKNELSLLKSFVVENFDCEIQIIIYIRNPISFSISNAQELVRAGLYTLGNALKIGGGNLQLIKSKIQNFVDIFGIDVIKLFSYDDVVKEYKDVVRHFVRKALVVDGGDFALSLHNTSMSFEKTLILSAIQNQDRKIWDFVCKSIPSHGSKIVPGPSLVDKLRIANLSDIDYAFNKFGINLNDDENRFSFPAFIDLNLFKDCLNIIESRFKNISAQFLVDQILIDIENVFPEVARQIFLMNNSIGLNGVCMKKKYIFICLDRSSEDLINKFFADIVGSERCAIHLESDSRWKNSESWIEILEKHDYISGNFGFWDLQSKVDVNKFNVFTFLYDPREYVVSHLTWILHLADSVQEENSFAYPECIRRLSKKLSSVNFLLEKDVIDFFENLTQEELSFLDNPQTRHLRSGKNQGLVNIDDVSDAVQALEGITDFGLIDRLGLDLELIVGSEEFCLTQSVSKENIFFQNCETDLINNNLFFALNKFIKFDLILYDYAIKLKSKRIIESLDVDLDSSEYVISVDRISEKSIHGWIKLAGNRLVNNYIDVFVNCCYVGQLLPNKARPDLLKAFGLNCGFNFYLKHDKFIKNGDVISMVDSKSRKIIKEVSALIEAK